MERELGTLIGSRIQGLRLGRSLDKGHNGESREKKEHEMKPGLMYGLRKL